MVASARTVQRCLLLLAMEAFNYTAPVIFKTEAAGAVVVFTREEI